MIKVRFIGKDDPLALRTGKIYDAIIGQKGLYGIIDETGEEYGYPPHLFEVVTQRPAPATARGVQNTESYVALGVQR